MENKNIINIGEKRIIADTISLLNSIDHSKFIKNLFDRFNRYFNIELIQEEIFETQLKENFVNAKKEALKNFELLVVALEKTNDVCNFTKFLSNVYIDPVVNFQTYNTYTFKNYNLPKQVKDYFEKEKNSTGDIIKIISKINPNPFDDTIVNGLTDAYKRGGNVGLRFFDIDIDFAILDPNVIKWIKKHGLELSKNVTKQMSSAIRYELINGLKNNESILELKKEF